jgi:biopolymer transport protein ExbB/TolQ
MAAASNINPVTGQPYTQDELSLKNLQDYYDKVAKAEANPSALAAQRIAFAQQRQRNVAGQRMAFEQEHPEYSAASIAAEVAKRKADEQSKKNLMIGAGVLALGGASYFAWKKWWRK